MPPIEKIIQFLALVMFLLYGVTNISLALLSWGIFKTFFPALLVVLIVNVLAKIVAKFLSTHPTAYSNNVVGWGRVVLLQLMLIPIATVFKHTPHVEMYSSFCNLAMFYVFYEGYNGPKGKRRAKLLDSIKSKTKSVMESLKRPSYSPS